MLERGILRNDVIEVIGTGNVLESYFDDYPCPSILIEGISNGNRLQVVVGKCKNNSVIITTYRVEEL